MEHIFPFVFLIVSLSVTTCSGNHYGVIYAEDAGDSGYNGFYCMVYNPRFHRVPTQVKDAAKVEMADLTPATFCDDPVSDEDLAGKAIAISRGNCTFSEKARNVQDVHGQITLIISKEELSEPVANLTSDYLEINITVALMGVTSFQHLKGLGKRVMVQLYAPVTPRVDYNLILIWVLAVGTVVLGAYWSGVVKNQQRLQRYRLSQRRSEAAPGEELPDELQEEQETFDVSPKYISIFVVMMCIMLVSLYFLYDYLVYFIIAIFTIASSASLYSVLKLVLIRIPFIGRCRLPHIRLPFISGQPEVRRVVLILMCLAVGIWWAVERKADYSWILQDLLGTVFCMHMLKTVRLSSLKTCTILLVLLFFYDIFFVFITPLLTKTGQSVMVDVATGGDSTTGEMLPMVLRVPRFDTSVLSVCSLPYSLLGFGDILVPGLLVSYCHGFDLMVQSGRVYFFSCTIAYGIGLMLTFMALALMNSGQPALLYLVPCTLLTTFVIAATRREMRHIWRGELDQLRPKATDTTPNITSTSTDPDAPHDATTSNVVNNEVTIPNGNAGPATLQVANGITTGGSDPMVTDHSFQSDNEHQYLIQR